MHIYEWWKPCNKDRSKINSTRTYIYCRSNICHNGVHIRGAPLYAILSLSDYSNLPSSVVVSLVFFVSNSKDTFTGWSIYWIVYVAIPITLKSNKKTSTNNRFASRKISSTGNLMFWLPNMLQANSPQSAKNLTAHIC